MPDNNLFKFPNIQRYIRNVVDPFLISLRSTDRNNRLWVEQEIAKMQKIQEDACTIDYGAVIPFHRVQLGGVDGRRPIFWGRSEIDIRWCVADGGTDYDGGTVPDCRDRFILGSGLTYDGGDKAGSKSHTHTANNLGNAHTLTISEMPKHTHKVPQGSMWSWNGTKYASGDDYTNDVHSNPLSSSSGGGQAHSHSTWGATVDTAITIPPFYALCYLVRLPI